MKLKLDPFLDADAPDFFNVAGPRAEGQSVHGL